MINIYQSFLKRWCDVILSLSALIVLLPVFLLVGLLLYVANEGAGVFFLQRRPGKNAKIFELIKFKTMTDKKDKNGILLPDAERLTRIGRFIRSFSMDELPQFINILKGEMSFIGPRPLAEVYLPYYSELERHRHNVRPGITGLAQINGRKALTWEQRFCYDIEYVNNISFLLDFKIFVMTIIKIVKRENVNVDSQGAVDFHKWRMDERK